MGELPLKWDSPGCRSFVFVNASIKHRYFFYPTLYTGNLPVEKKPVRNNPFQSFLHLAYTNKKPAH